MRRMLSALCVVAAIAATTAPVLTVTNGQPDANRHPYVGVAIQPIPSLPGYVFVCSGAALSPTTFLTAAHCFESEPARLRFVPKKARHSARRSRPVPSRRTRTGASAVVQGFRVSTFTTSR